PISGHPSPASNPTSPTTSVLPAQKLPLNLLALLAAVTLPAFAWTHSDDLPRAQPEDAGFSSERLRYIDRYFAEGIERGDLAGIVTLVSRHGKIVHLSALGYADREKTERMHADTIFRLYSQTKAIATTALMMLYEEGRFQLTDPVAKYIPG